VSRPLPSSVAEYRAEAKRRLPRAIFDFIEGGAEDESTMRENRHALDRIRLVPRILVDVSRRSLVVDVLGETLALPIVLAPTGLAGLIHSDGEVAAALGAHSQSTQYIAPTVSTYSIEEVSNALDKPCWFQLYPWGDRTLIKDLMGRAHQAGVRVLVVTVDAPLAGNRERDRRNGLTLPPRMTASNAVELLRHPRWTVRTLWRRRVSVPNLDATAGRDLRKAVSLVARSVNLFNPAIQLSDLEWIRGAWAGRLAVKGILSVEDAQRVVSVGADAVIVSNHGGRQLDGAVASISALPSIVSAVGERVDVLMDGGIRRGVDVVRALSLGAKACLIGRPYLYGLGAYGQRGVEGVISVFRQELDRCMALIGETDVKALHASTQLRHWYGPESFGRAD